MSTSENTLRTLNLKNFWRNARWFDENPNNLTMKIFIVKELGHDPSQYQLQMDHNRQIHILLRNQAEESEQAKVN